MIVEVSDESVVTADVVDRAQFIIAVLKNDHEWIAPAPDEEWLVPFYEGLGDIAESLSYIYYKTNAWGAHTVSKSVMRVSNRDSDALSVDRAAAVLSRPLEILVENALGDGETLRSMLDCLGRPISRLLANERVVFAHAGGKSDTLNQLEARQKQIARSPGPLRVAVVVDSDSRFPTDPGKDTQKVQKRCAELSVPVHVLLKRKIENYFPNRVIDSYVDRWPDRLIDARFVKGLSQVQRNHHPIKEALRPSINSDWPLQQAILYAGLALTDLQSRKLPGLTDHAVDLPWVCEREDLDEVDARVEVEALAKLIEESY